MCSLLVSKIYLVLLGFRVLGLGGCDGMTRDALAFFWLSAVALSLSESARLSLVALQMVL